MDEALRIGVEVADALDSYEAVATPPASHEGSRSRVGR